MNPVFRRFKQTALAGLILASLPSQTSAQEKQSGNWMMRACDEKAPLDEYTYCLGRLDAFMSGFILGKPYGEEVWVCEPVGVTLGQRKDVLLKYLKDHPERRQVDWSLLFLHAMVEAFPCSSETHTIVWDSSRQSIRVASKGGE